jgi:hypothetical protein
MKAMGFFETLVTIYKTTRLCKKEDHNPNTYTDVQITAPWFDYQHYVFSGEVSRAFYMRIKFHTFHKVWRMDGLYRIIMRCNNVSIRPQYQYFGSITTEKRSSGSSGSIVSDYGLDDRGSIPDRGFFF